MGEANFEDQFTSEETPTRVGSRKTCDADQAWIRFSLSFDFVAHDREFAEERFPYDDVPKCYVHSEIPIVRMSMRQVVDTVEGLEWKLRSDVFDVNPDRGNPEWIRRFRRALDAVDGRARFLATHGLNEGILNVADYTYEEEKETTENKNTFVEEDYESDDEYKKKRPQIEMVVVKRSRTCDDDDEDDDPDEIEGIKGKMTRKRIYANENFAFDYCTLWRSCVRALRSYESSYVPATPSGKVDVTNFRKRVVAEVDRGYEWYAVDIHIDRWFCDLTVNESHDRIYERRNPEDLDFPATFVLSSKSVEYHESIKVASLKEIVELPKGRTPAEKTRWKRNFTDALFYFVSENEIDGSPLRVLFEKDWTKALGVDEPRIYRVPIPGVFVAHVDSTERYACDSAMAAFVVLRRRMKIREKPSIVYAHNDDPRVLSYKVDVSVFDEWFS